MIVRGVRFFKRRVLWMGYALRANRCLFHFLSSLLLKSMAYNCVLGKES